MLPLYKILDRKLSDCIGGSKDERFVNFFMAESFSERKGLLSQMLARKGQVLGVQSKPSAAGLGGEGSVSSALEFTGSFIYRGEQK